MAIQQTLTTSFKQEMLQGGQNLLTDILNMALYTGFATIGPTTTEYVTDNEVVGAGYTATQSVKKLCSREVQSYGAEGDCGRYSEGRWPRVVGAIQQALSALLGPVLRGRPRPRETAAKVRRFYSMGHSEG